MNQITRFARACVLAILIAGCALYSLGLLATSTPQPAQPQDYAEWHLEYQGQQLDGRFDGEGTLVLEDGATYQGGFRNGRFQGPGTLTFADGSTLRATFDNGAIQGAAEATNSDGVTRSVPPPRK